MYPVQFHDAFILDHCPEDQPVVPFVCVANAFLEVLRTHVQSAVVLKNLQIVRGVKSMHETFWIRVEQDMAILQDQDGVVAYKTSFHTNAPTDGQDFSCPLDYQGQPADYDFLFHGPQLQTIESWMPFGPQGAFAHIRNAASMHWDKTSWALDPALADGVLQLGCQLAGTLKGKTSLPVTIEEVAVFAEKIAPAVVPCRIEIRSINPLRYIYDAWCPGYFQLIGIHAYFRNKK